MDNMTRKETIVLIMIYNDSHIELFHLSGHGLVPLWLDKRGSTVLNYKQEGVRERGTKEAFLQENFSVRRSLFSKLLGTRFSSIQLPFSLCRSVLFRDMSKNASCGPAVSCSGSV